MEPSVLELKATNKQLFRVPDDLKKVVNQRDMAQQEMIETHFESMYRLALDADFREGRDGQRLLRMGVSAEILARALGMPEDYCSMIRRAAPLHDIGMIAIADSLLRKKTELDDDEWQLWRNHTLIGARILSSSFNNPLMRMASEIALTHHEAFAGIGYPAKLAGENIPLSGRILALAEYLEIHTHTARQRAGPVSPEAVLASVGALSGHRFDPKLVALLPANLETILDACGAIDHKANSFQDLIANSKPTLVPTEDLNQPKANPS